MKRRDFIALCLVLLSASLHVVIQAQERLVERMVTETQIDSSPGVVVSDDLRHVAREARGDEKSSVVIDGKQQMPYDQVYSILFSHESRHVAYTAQAGQSQSTTSNER